MSKQENNTNASVMYKRLLKYAMPYWKVFSLAVVGMVIYAGTQVSFAEILKPMMDGGFVDKDPESMFWVPIILV